VTKTYALDHAATGNGGEIDIYAKHYKLFKSYRYCIINAIFKPNLVPKHSRLRVYVLAKPTLVYGSKAWTIKEQDEK
jgi:hypothetical protein